MSSAKMAMSCWYRIVAVHVFMLYASRSARGADTKTVSIQPAMLNQSVTLPCHTDLFVAVDWWYQPTPSDSVQQICMNGEIVAIFRDRFRIDSSKSRDYNLVITNPKLSDAGIYTCVEDAGLSTRHVMNLIVLTAVAGVSAAAAVPYATATEYHSDDAVTPAADNSDVSWTTSDDERATLIKSTASPTNYVIVIVATVAATVVVAVVAASSCLIYRRKRSKSKSDAEESHESQKLTPSGGEQMDAHVDRNHENVSSSPVSAQLNASLNIRTCDHAIHEHRKFNEEGVPMIESLPMTLRYNIFDKSIVKLFKSTMANVPNADVTSVVTIASVTKQWWQMVGIQLFKGRIAQLLNDVCSPYRRHPVQRDQIKTNKSIVAVAYMQGEVFIADASLKSLKVYQLVQPDQQARSIRFTAYIRNVSDMVAWDAQQSLFIADQYTGSLSKVDKHGKITNWYSTKAPGERHKVSIYPCRISIAQGKLAVSMINHRLIIFDSNGQQLTTTDFDDNLDPNYTAVSPIDGKLIACLNEGSSYSDAQLENNKLRKRIFKAPFMLTFDSDGRPFTCGRRDQFIYIRTSNLRKQRIILERKPEGDRKLPNIASICYIQSTGQLLIAESNNVSIYDVLAK